MRHVSSNYNIKMVSPLPPNIDPWWGQESGRELARDIKRKSLKRKKTRIEEKLEKAKSKVSRRQDKRRFSRRAETQACIGIVTCHAVDAHLMLSINSR